MADSEETRLISISTQLNAMVSEGKTDDTIAILRSLRDEDISVRLLKKTQIGRAVNNVRRNSSNEEVISLAKKIVNKWRRSAESQYSSVVAETGELPCSQMSQMTCTEETQMSQTQETATAGHSKTKVHLEKERNPGKKETELTQDPESQSLLPPSNTGALPLFQTEAPDDDRGTGLASSQGRTDKKEQEHDSDRETSHKQGQDNLLSQQTQQSNNSERQNPDKLYQNNMSTTTGGVEGSHANSSDGETSLERGSDDSNSQQTHLFCCDPNKERKDCQNQQASVPVEPITENTARTDKGLPRASTSTNHSNSTTTQNTSERPLTDHEIQSLRRDVSQIQKQVARIESVLTMLFTPLKQNLDRVSKKLSSLEQRQTAQNSQNALSSSHDALSETETQLDWLGNLDGGTTSLSGPSFSPGSNSVKTHHPQSSSQHSVLPHSLKVKSEPVDHGYDLATANQIEEMSVSQETEGSPSQLLFPQMTEDGGITFESLIGYDDENKTTIDSKPGPSTKPDVIPRKKLKLEHHSKERDFSWMAAGSDGKMSAFQDKCSDASGLKVIQEGTDSDDDLGVFGSHQYVHQEGAMGHQSPPVLETPDNPSASNYQADFSETETFGAEEESQPPQRVALESDFRPERVKWLRQNIEFTTFDRRISCAELRARLRQHFGYTSDQELGKSVKEAFPDVQRTRKRVKGQQSQYYYYACLQWVESATSSL
uniref:TFIIS N-terminal domain-containing protein n=1 Tax=Branchiostoma floridae TaxID=7739 RepID=C3Z9K5_BRAFL|eukprot:XP_002594690.1 hypothetical protein BRAFLDRAFT_101450 [Branchiostoma floridae]